ncbi:MAG: TolC family protein [Firmicutes bacterium]|nr:TolC family protein [Bacillota bacterium]
MVFPESKREKAETKARHIGTVMLLCLTFLLVAGISGTQSVIAQEEVIGEPKGVLHTYSLEETVLAALKQNAALWQAELQVRQAQAAVLAEQGKAELQGFMTPIVGAGTLGRLEWAEKAIDDETIRKRAADQHAWEGGLRVGFSKPLSTGGLFSLGLNWGAAAGLGSTELGEKVYSTALISEITWNQPLWRNPTTLEPWWAIQTADDVYVKAKLTRDTITRDVIVAVTTMFFETVQANEQLDVALKALESMQEQRRMVEDRVSRGLGGSLDLRTAEIEMAAAQHAVSQSRRHLDLARRRLSQATGLSLSGMTRLAPPPPITWGTTLDVAITTALHNSIDLQRLEVDLNAARRAWLKAQEEKKPRFDTNWSLNQAGEWRVGLEVTWSFWDGHTAQQRLEAAALELQKVNTQLETITEEIKLNIRRAHYDYLASEEQVELADLKFTRAEELLETTRRRYGLRMTTELEMMNALNQVREAKAEQSSASYARTCAAIQLLACTDQLGRVFPNISWDEVESRRQ